MYKWILPLLLSDRFITVLFVSCLQALGVLDSGWHQHTTNPFWAMELYNKLLGFPGGARGKEPACQRRRHEFDPWVRKIPWRKKMETHSSILSWRIPWIEEPGRLQSTGLPRVWEDWSDWAQHTHTSYTDKILVLHCFDDCLEGARKEVMLS